MKNVLLVLFLLHTTVLIAKKNNVTIIAETNTSIIDSYRDLIDDDNKIKIDTRSSLINDNNKTKIDIKNTKDTNNSSIDDSNKTLSSFESKFVNHIAYRHYDKAVNLLYKKQYTKAYNEAISAKLLFNNEDKKEKLISLPYMSSYLRESGFAPKTMYYKIIENKPYQLKRLLTKIKLLSPPIPMIILKKTSTNIIVEVSNQGDLPLDEFDILINDTKVHRFDKINVNKMKSIKIDFNGIIEKITFKEAYGFAPKSIQIVE
jgi:hypothetical protein